MSSERPNRSRFAPGVSLGRPVEAQGGYAPSAAADESGGFKPVTGPAYTFRTFRIKENKPAAFPNKLTLLLVYFTCRCSVWIPRGKCLNDRKGTQYGREIRPGMWRPCTPTSCARKRPGRSCASRFCASRTVQPGEGEPVRRTGRSPG